MIAIFHDMKEKFLEMFIDDFTLYGLNFESYLDNLSLVLQTCEESNLMLNYENTILWCVRRLFLVIESPPRR